MMLSMFKGICITLLSGCLSHELEPLRVWEVFPTLPEVADGSISIMNDG
jgi:hypothetical protein